MKVDYTKEQAEQVLKDFHEFHRMPIYNSATSDFLSHKFPETDYVGKLVKLKDSDLAVAFCYGKNESGELMGYGFKPNGTWFNSNENGFPIVPKSLEIKITQATEEEWKEALIKEAKRRYKVGDKVRSLYRTKNEYVLDLHYHEETYDYAFRQNGEIWGATKPDENGCRIGILLMKDGIWAEIVEQPEQDLTPEQANESLQKFAKWFGDNFKNLK